MKISIITVTYNSAATLDRTIQSIEAQHFKDLEYIVIDGGSTDGTLDIIKQHQSSIAYVVSEPDNGIYDAINKGLHVATGDIIGILNSDDVLAEPTTLETIADHMQAGVDISYGDLLYFRIQKDKENIVRFWHSNAFQPNSLKKGWMPAHPTLYIRREIYTKVGDYDTRFRISADYDFILRSFSIDGIQTEYIPQVLVKMAIGGISNRNLKCILQKSLEDYRAIRKNKIGGWNVVLRKNLQKINQFFREY